ncbi:MAG: DnaJ domain-containing protein [Candidatus Rifleibacteriota bacterium]
MKRTVRMILFLILAVLYTILPTDIIPDFLGRVGRIDDLLIILLVVYYFFFKPLVDDFRKKSSAPKGETKENITDPYEILGVSRTADFKAIKALYLQKIRQYHPDLVENLGPEIKKTAQKESQKLNEAFEKIKKEKGI